MLLLSFFFGLFISAGPLGFCVMGALGAGAGLRVVLATWALQPWGVFAVAAPGSPGTQAPFAMWVLKDT